MKLVISAGERRLADFKHHDIQPLDGLDYVCDFFDLPKHIKKNSCDEIHFTHALEHFPMAKTRQVLELIYGLLAPAGKLYIEVPNFYWHALEIISNPLNTKIIEYAFGGQLNEYDYHYTGFTPELLHEHLTLSGYIVDNLAPNSSIECWSHKP